VVDRQAIGTVSRIAHGEIVINDYKIERWGGQNADIEVEPTEMDRERKRGAIRRPRITRKQHRAR
jgi:hypothetical protein